MFRLVISTICLVAFAAPLHATVAEDEPDVTWASPTAPMLTVGNALLTIVNAVQVADTGSYGLGALGIATGVAGLVVSGQLDERSMLVDIPAALSLTVGTLSILRRIGSADTKGVSVAPAFTRGGVGASLMIRF